MRILVTGGSGGIGRELVPLLVGQGHRVVSLDPEAPPAGAEADPSFEWVRGTVEDPAALEEGLDGAEAVIHLAWSFADDPAALLDRDLRGTWVLMDRARERGVRHVVYASSAVVYGRPIRTPVDEDHPLRVVEGRKPAYAVAKAFAENLALLAGRTGGPAATVLRIWWAFGREIGGRHLRDLLRGAASGNAVSVPADCGGTFLSMEDLARAIEMILASPASFGQTFNIGSAYVGWEEIARLVLTVTGAKVPVEAVPASRWTGAAFLSDRWELDLRWIRERIGFHPARDADGIRWQLRSAISNTWSALTCGEMP